MIIRKSSPHHASIGRPAHEQRRRPDRLGLASVRDVDDRILIVIHP